VCKACFLVKYCNANCQRNHWPTHKADCKQRAASYATRRSSRTHRRRRTNCPICFLPMPDRLINCVSLPPATITSVPIYDYARANQEFAMKETEAYYSCCGKYICRGCLHSSYMSGNDKCPFCNSDRSNNTRDEMVEDNMRRVEANDATSIFLLAVSCYHGLNGIQQDHARARTIHKGSRSW
jgi:hypothetical protein